MTGPLPHEFMERAKRATRAVLGLPPEAVAVTGNARRERETRWTSEHDDLVHVWHPHAEYVARDMRDGGAAVQVKVMRCGCGVEWHRASVGDDWQQDRYGNRRQVHPLWELMEHDRDAAIDASDRDDLVRSTQRDARRLMTSEVVRADVAAAMERPLPELAKIDPRAGRRKAKELGVWDDRFFHYEVEGGDVLVYNLERRGAPVWKFSVTDLPDARGR